MALTYLEGYQMDNKIPPVGKSGNTASTILMPLPDHDFDPTEAAIPWKVLHSKGWGISFCTERGDIAEADANKFKGPLPGLISASAETRDAYHEMVKDTAFHHPIPYEEINASQFRAILLPGGDGLRMRQILDSGPLRQKVLDFWRQNKLVGAICHGILVLARTIDPDTGHSILYGRKVTALPKRLDRAAYKLDSWLSKHGYIMYSECVADEVRACLKSSDDLIPGPGIFAPYAFTDGNLVTARYYLDAHEFAEQFVKALE
jgi:putative intracellular protease/amidase